MQTFIEHKILGESLLLSSERAIYWQQKKILVVSDMHLGKTGHFRKSGIAVPQAIFKEDMQRLVNQLQYFKPDQLVVIGDMFHSHDNKEHDYFLKWRQDFSSLNIQLIKGNHDILKQKWYDEAAINIVNCEMVMDTFSFVHDFMDCEPGSGRYIFSGHIHPGISIRGLGKQSVHLPCFYFGETYAVLPAFSRFTGMYSIKPKPGEDVYALISANPQKGQAGGIIKI